MTLTSLKIQKQNRIIQFPSFSGMSLKEYNDRVIAFSSVLTGGGDDGAHSRNFWGVLVQIQG